MDFLVCITYSNDYFNSLLVGLVKLVQFVAITVFILVKNLRFIVNSHINFLFPYSISIGNEGIVIPFEYKENEINFF